MAFEPRVREEIVVMRLPSGLTVGCRVFTAFDPKVVARIHIALLLAGDRTGRRSL